MENEVVREHNESFRNIFGRLGKLETDMAQVMPWKERVDMDLYNHGQDGMKTILTKFVTEARTREDEHRKALRLITVVVLFLTLVVAWLAYMQTLHNIHSGLLFRPKVTHSSPPVLSEYDGHADISSRIAFYEENTQ